MKLTIRKSKVGNRRGYTLIELLATFAVVALIAGLCLPVLPLTTGETYLDSLGLDIASLLRDARTLSQSKAATEVVQYNSRGNILSGAARSIQFASDVGFSFKSGAACDGFPIIFRPDGTNCGSILRVSRGSRTVTIRVNWIDGGIEVSKTT